MADLPFMMMDWGRFFTDAKVVAMPTEAQGVYALLLGRMWLNEGWLSADDRVLARMLGLDIRTWRTAYKPHIVPLLRQENAAHVGPIYVQKHLQRVRASSLEYRDKMRERTAPARAAKARKLGLAPPATEKRPEPVTRSATETVTTPVTEPVTIGKEQVQENRSLTSQSERPILDAPTGHDTALPPRKVEVPQFEVTGLDEAPADDRLRKRLVAEGLKPKGGLLGSLNMGK